MGIYHLLNIYQSTYLSNHLSININLLSISIIYLLSIIFIIYHYWLFSLLSIAINYLLSVYYLPITVNYLAIFSLSLWRQDVPPCSSSREELMPRCGGIRSAGILVSRAPPQLCPGGSVRVSGLVQDGPRRPGSHSAACWVCRVGCGRATASPALLLSLAFPPPLHSCWPYKHLYHTSGLARLLSKSPVDYVCWCVSVSVCVCVCAHV